MRISDWSSDVCSSDLAHRHEAVAAAGALELVEGLGEQDGAGAAEGVTEGDRAAVGVGLLGGEAELLLPGEHDRGEGLVDLGDVDVGGLEAGALEQALRGVDRAGEHENGVDADEAGVDDERTGGEAELLRSEEHTSELQSLMSISYA